MSRLFSYCLPFDDGAAPNPYWGICTLVICKPRIRAAARKGDWVVGTGAKRARCGDGTTRDLTGRLVYAMRVTDVMTMPQYDTFATTHLTGKVPEWRTSDHRRRVGDAIYQFSGGKVVQRTGVHGRDNQDTDLSGKNALLSDDFVYFGANAVELPLELRVIAQNRQGHRATLNEPYVATFVSWLRALGHSRGALLGQPLLNLFLSESCARWCAAGRGEHDDQDQETMEACGGPL